MAKVTYFLYKLYPNNNIIEENKLFLSPKVSNIMVQNNGPSTLHIIVYQYLSVCYVYC